MFILFIFLIKRTYIFVISSFRIVFTSDITLDWEILRINPCAWKYPMMMYRFRLHDLTEMQSIFLSHLLGDLIYRKLDKKVIFIEVWTVNTVIFTFYSRYEVLKEIDKAFLIWTEYFFYSIFLIWQTWWTVEKWNFITSSMTLINYHFFHWTANAHESYRHQEKCIFQLFIPLLSQISFFILSWKQGYL